MHLTSLSPLGTSASLELQVFGLPIRCGRKRMSFLSPWGSPLSFSVQIILPSIPFVKCFCLNCLIFCKPDSKRECRLGGPPSSRSLSPEKELENHAVEHGGADAVGQHRPGDHKHLGAHAHDQPLWLCQDRHTVFSEFFQLPPKWGALIVLACRYKFKPARSTHIYLNLS